MLFTSVLPIIVISLRKVNSCYVTLRIISIRLCREGEEERKRERERFGMRPGDLLHTISLTTPVTRLPTYRRYTSALSQLPLVPSLTPR